MESDLVFPAWLGPILGIGGAIFLVGLLSELVVLHFRKSTLRLRESRMAGLSTLLLMGPFRGLSEFVVGGAAIFACTALASRFSPFSIGNHAIAWLYGFVVYELCYWLYHFAAHRVRILWCGHAGHHSPEELTLLAGTTANPIDSEIHLNGIVGLGCGLLGLPPMMVLVFNIIDRSYAAFLHSSQWLMPKGRYGPLGLVLQTPWHHRVHHARNPVYKDRNLAPITQLWDRLLGTYQPQLPDEPPDCGITRRPDTGSVLDVHLGEYRLLGRDLRNAETWRERFAIAFGAPDRPSQSQPLAAERA